MGKRCTSWQLVSGLCMTASWAWFPGLAGAQVPESTPRQANDQSSQILEKLEKVEKRLEALEKRLAEAEQAKKEARPSNFRLLGQWLRGGRPRQGLLIQAYSSDPNTRMTELLNKSEDLRKIREEWERIWFTDEPSHLTPEKVDGGIQ